MDVDRQAARWTGRQNNRQTDLKWQGTDGDLERQLSGWMDGWAEGYVDGSMAAWMDKLTEKQMVDQTGSCVVTL